MNADLSIHRMAFREADTLGLAQLLVVKKRQDLELRLLLERVPEGSQTAGAGIDAALRRMTDASEVRVFATGEDIGAVVDKTA